jgi:SAM-dependent methyltransferase
MLQLRRLSADALDSLAARTAFPPPWNSLPELRSAADTYCRSFLDERSALARARFAPTRLCDALDRRLRTDAVEYLDRSDFPAERKLRLVRALHRINRLLGTYRLCFRLLEPLIRAVSEREGRPARVLELASGSGEFTLDLVRAARRKNLAVEVTGSDYIPEYVRAAAANAARRGLDAEFRVLDAFDFASGCAEGEFDVVFVAQSLHHFSPGQLATMIAQARRVATTAFVGVDGFRSLWVLTTFPLLAASAFNAPFLHDAVLSARKFYSDAELALLGAIAAPDARVKTATRQPGFSVLTVRWDAN